MSTRTNSLRRTGTLLATASIVAGMIATGCSNTTSHTGATTKSATPTSATVPMITIDTSELVTTSTSTTVPVAPVVVTPTTHSGHSPAPAPAPAPAPTSPATTSPVPSSTLGEPPVSVPPPLVTIGPILVPILFFPTVSTVSAQLHFTCLEAAIAGFATQVSWTTNHASSVTVTVDGGVFATGLATNSNIYVPLGCGDSQTVVVSARWADGSAGGSRTIVIKVDPV